MPSGFKNTPKIFHGAFVEYGLSIPPLIVPFQFNPVQLTRNRSLSFVVPQAAAQLAPEDESDQAKARRLAAQQTSLREFHHRQEFSDILELQKQQKVNVQEESISFEIRLDATDKLNEGDPVTAQFGIAPQLSALELFTLPKGESILGAKLDMLDNPVGHSNAQQDRPPMVLFIWGVQRVLPVNINSMNITENEFNSMLNPIRATVSVNLTVIEGPNKIYSYSKVMKEAMAAVNLTSLIDVTDIQIPG